MAQITDQQFQQLASLWQEGSNVKFKALQMEILGEQIFVKESLMFETRLNDLDEESCILGTLKAFGQGMVLLDCRGFPTPVDSQTSPNPDFSGFIQSGYPDSLDKHKILYSLNCFNENLSMAFWSSTYQLARCRYTFCPVYCNFQLGKIMYQEPAFSVGITPARWQLTSEMFSRWLSQ